MFHDAFITCKGVVMIVQDLPLIGGGNISNLLQHTTTWKKPRIFVSFRNWTVVKGQIGWLFELQFCMPRQ